ncbi:synaptic vesicle membrane protein VAT-1 homolog [Schistocerca cancellata]|uniref:synaptic vesicle membrane protein VAT-1 homolog n=1 Tax=Schistocerca cancellata TaxID=274614 RepID=UPI0021193D26|nr:synaptic vesicle membrane protein VAT-1 homolog [Schistocerca cancellata]
MYCASIPCSMTDSSPLHFTAPHVKRPSDSERVVPSLTLIGHGDIDRIKVTNAPLPEAPSADEVEVDIYYCGMNFTDNYLRLGLIKNSHFPVIMGSECAGIITRVGANVTDFKVGHRVLCLRMQGGLFRHIVHVQQRNCFLIPDPITLLDAVGIGLNFLMAHLCLFDFGHLRKGQVVFMESIAGGVGTAVCQLARTVPLVTVMGTASQIKHANVSQLGTHRVLLHQENYEDVVAARCPRGVDIIINSSGGSYIEKYSKLLRPCGKLINIGSNNSAIYPESSIWGFLKPKWDTTYIPTADLTSRNYSVAGINIGSLLQSDQDRLRRVLIDIFSLHIKKRIRSHVDVVLPFERFEDGFRQLCTRSNCGKIVLRVKMEPEPPAAVVTHVSLDDLSAHKIGETSNNSSCADGKHEDGTKAPEAS